MAYNGKIFVGGKKGLGPIYGTDPSFPLYE